MCLYVNSRNQEFQARCISHMSFICQEGGMDWQKIRENILLGIPRILRYIYINNHIFDNSIQITIKFTFSVYEYVFCYTIW